MIDAGLSGGGLTPAPARRGSAGHCRMMDSTGTNTPLPERFSSQPGRLVSLDGVFRAPDARTMDIATVIYIAFSAFDEAVVPVKDIRGADRSYSYVGLLYVTLIGTH